ncbi:hypothetical protein OPT61_g10141 [Boeremia exigua]|uniref:Uncharacterized protein n=1 Tax=Boeremia exigua TaxID=749465 RepID=A0ACC2HRI9_9PLEO|nr:hypothetical protein OPT61_g10141 [Boeremia exigua]
MAPPPEYNVGVPDLEYFTPQHITSPGTPENADSTAVPKLFQPLTIRGTTLRNRILVAPMCQYSTASHGPATGALTDYHIATLGHYALKGAALVMVEATGVQANGRISPNCPASGATRRSPRSAESATSSSPRAPSALSNSPTPAARPAPAPPGSPARSAPTAASARSACARARPRVAGPRTSSVPWAARSGRGTVRSWTTRPAGTGRRVR